MPSTIPSNSPVSRKILVILALSLFIVALILVIVSSVTTKKGTRLLSGSSYADGYNAARDQALELGIVPASESVRVLNGIVTEVKNGRLTVKTNLFVDERVDGVGNSRTILTNANTKIIVRTQKDPAIFDQEMRTFFDSMRDENAGTPPSSYDEKAGSISDIVVGDAVMITVADAEQDLTLANNITAATISIRHIPVEPQFVEPEASDEPMPETVPEETPQASDSQDSAEAPTENPVE